jgi:hypothetical protein
MMNNCCIHHHVSVYIGCNHHPCLCALAVTIIPRLGTFCINLFTYLGAYPVTQVGAYTALVMSFITLEGP